MLTRLLHANRFPYSGQTRVCAIATLAAGFILVATAEGALAAPNDKGAKNPVPNGVKVSNRPQPTGINAPSAIPRNVDRIRSGANFVAGAGVYGAKGVATGVNGIKVGAKAVGSGIKEGAGAVADGAKAVGRRAKLVGHGLKDAAKSGAQFLVPSGTEIKEASKIVAKPIGKVGSAVGSGIKTGAKTGGSGVKTGAKKVGSVAKKAVKKIFSVF